MRIDSVSSDMAAQAQTKAQAQTDQGFAEQLAKAAGGNAAATTQEDAKIKDACQQMEAVFLNMLYNKMQESVPKSKLIGEDSQAEDIMRSMLNTELSKNMAKAGGIGLADMMYKQMKQDAALTKKIQAPK